MVNNTKLTDVYLLTCIYNNTIPTQTFLNRELEKQKAMKKSLLL